MDFLSKIVSGNINRIKQNIFNSFVQDLDIQKGFDDELEKGKWNVGDQRFYHGTMHYVAELKPDGSPRWRRVKKNSGASGDATNSDFSDKKNDDKNTSDVKNNKSEEDKIFSRLRVLNSKINVNDISKEDWDRAVSIMRQTDPNKISAVKSLTEDKVSDKFLEIFREVSNHLFLSSGKNESESDRWSGWRYLATEELNKRKKQLRSDLDKLKDSKNTPSSNDVSDNNKEKTIGKKPKKSDSSALSNKSSVSKKTSEKTKKDGSQIKSVMNRIKEDFKNGVPMIQKNSKTETSYRIKTIGIKEFGEKLKTDYGKKFAKSFNKFSFKDVDFSNDKDKDDRYSVHDYFFHERGFDKIEDIADIHADNHKNESDLGLWITKNSIRQSFLSKEWDKTKYKIPYNGKNYHFVAETNLFMKKEGDGSYIPKLEYKINLVGVSNSDGTKRIKHVSTLGVCYTKSIDYPYSESKEEESKNFEKLKEHYKKVGQRCKDVALYNFVSNFDGYFSKINI